MRLPPHAVPRSLAAAARPHGRPLSPHTPPSSPGRPFSPVAREMQRTLRHRIAPRAFPRLLRWPYEPTFAPAPEPPRAFVPHLISCHTAPHRTQCSPLMAGGAGGMDPLPPSPFSALVFLCAPVKSIFLQRAYMTGPTFWTLMSRNHQGNIVLAPAVPLAACPRFLWYAQRTMVECGQVLDLRTAFVGAGSDCERPRIVRVADASPRSHRTQPVLLP